MCLCVSVGEALNHLSALESLSHTIASIKCNLDRIMNNGNNPPPQTHVHTRTHPTQCCPILSPPCPPGSQDLGCCPLDWVSFESSCYFFSKSMLSWDKARDWCNTRDSHLVILHEDKDWVRRRRTEPVRHPPRPADCPSVLLQKFVTAHTSGLFHWIGLTDERTGQWEWVNQTPYVMNRMWV